MPRKEEPKDSSGPPGDMIYVLRILKGWTRLQLAQRASITGNLVWRYEKNKENYGRKTLDKIAKQFDIPSQCLFVPQSLTEPLIKLINKQHFQKPQKK